MQNKYLQLNDEQYHHILGELQKLPKEINQQINLTNKKLIA